MVSGASLAERFRLGGPACLGAIQRWGLHRTVGSLLRPRRNPRLLRIQVEAWVNTTSQDPSYLVDNRLVDEGRGLSLFMGYGAAASVPGQPVFAFDTRNRLQGIAGPNIADGKWHHVVGVWSAPAGTVVDQSQFKMFVDAVQVGTPITVCYEACNVASPLTGGAPTALLVSSPGVPSFIGGLDEVAVYDHVLTAAQVEAHYLAARPSAPGVSCGKTVVDYPATSPASGWVFVDQAATFGNPQPDGSLRLSQGGWNVQGAAWWQQAVPIDFQASFCAKFGFRFPEHYGYRGGGDGMSLVFAKTRTAPMTGGGSLGLGNLNPSVAIELDTFPNYGSDPGGGAQDPDGNHVGIDLNGNVISVATGTPPGTLFDGQNWNGWIEFDATTREMTVWTSPSASRPLIPTVSTVLPVATVTAMASGPTYVGFNASQGDTYQRAEALALTIQTDAVSRETTTALTGPVLPWTSGSSLTFTATTTAANKAAPVTGSVEFRDGTTLIETKPVTANGTVSFTIPAVTVGAHSFTAKFVGTTTLNPSTSPSLDGTSTVKSLRLVSQLNELSLIEPRAVPLVAKPSTPYGLAIDTAETLTPEQIRDLVIGRPQITDPAEPAPGPSDITTFMFYMGGMKTKSALKAHKVPKRYGWNPGTLGSSTFLPVIPAKNSARDYLTKINDLVSKIPVDLSETATAAQKSGLVRMAPIWVDMETPCLQGAVGRDSYDQLIPSFLPQPYEFGYSATTAKGYGNLPEVGKRKLLGLAYGAGKDSGRRAALVAQNLWNYPKGEIVYLDLEDINLDVSAGSQTIASISDAIKEFDIPSSGVGAVPAISLPALRAKEDCMAPAIAFTLGWFRGLSAGGFSPALYIGNNAWGEMQKIDMATALILKSNEIEPSPIRPRGIWVAGAAPKLDTALPKLDGIDVTKEVSKFSSIDFSFKGPGISVSPSASYVVASGRQFAIGRPARLRVAITRNRKGRIVRKDAKYVPVDFSCFLGEPKSGNASSAEVLHVGDQQTRNNDSERRPIGYFTDGCAREAGK
jgi:Legume lectin domain/Bacterial Ig-like domain (group 3)/Concanavalin A-like lectin/glucanases superfamily